MADCDQTSNDLEEIDFALNGSMNNTSLIDYWMENDPQFATSGRTVERMSSVWELDTEVWYEQWFSTELTQQVPENVHLKGKKYQDSKSAEDGHVPGNALLFKEPKELPKETKRERNKKYAKESRERQKKNFEDLKKDYINLSKENSKLTGETEHLQRLLRDLSIVKNSFIHQESCSYSQGDVDMNNLHIKPAMLVQAKKGAQTTTCCSGKTLMNDGQQMIPPAHQQQEPQPVPQDSCSLINSSINVAPSGSSVFDSYGTIVSSNPNTLHTIVGSFSQNHHSDNLEASNNESSVVALEPVKEQTNAISTDRCCQTRLPINCTPSSAVFATTPMIVSRTSQASSGQSAWCIETNQETDVEIQLLKSFFTKN